MVVGDFSGLVVGGDVLVVGAIVGDSVGLVEGERVGGAVGFVVGETVGLVVGGDVSVVGKRVGDVVGFEIGDTVGGVVGEFVGADIGKVGTISKLARLKEDPGRSGP